jgi:hypothetical protein
MISLVKIENGWQVSYLDDVTLAKHYRKFETIEPAADLMISLGVDTEAIDDALILIFTESDVRRVNFNKDGKLFSTDVI